MGGGKGGRRGGRRRQRRGYRQDQEEQRNDAEGVMKEEKEGAVASVPPSEM